MRITTRWKTFHTTNFEHSVTPEPSPSEGGVLLHQIRRTPSGGYLHRVVQVNRRWVDTTPATPATVAQVEAAKAAPEP